MRKTIIFADSESKKVMVKSPVRKLARHNACNRAGFESQIGDKVVD